MQRDTISTAGLSNSELSSDLPYLLADTSAPPIDFGTPTETYVGRGAPIPLNPQIPLWDFVRYNGYPRKDSVDLRDPMTLLGQYYEQPRLSCPTSGKTLYCCFPGEIMCEACEFDFASPSLSYLFPLSPREGGEKRIGSEKIEPRT